MSNRTPMENLKDKVVLISGASGGIGCAMARIMAKENCKLVLLGRRNSVLNELEREIKKTNPNVIAMKCDVSSQHYVKSVVISTKAIFGKIDIAVLNAGVSYKTDKNKFDSKLAEETFDTNVLGMIYFFEELIHEFKINGGMFVGVSSLADGRGFPKSGFYCASKAAVTLFLESQRIELKPFNIKVLTVKPGFVKTPMTAKNEFKMPFLMDAEKAAKIILRGIKKEKRIIQFPWQTVLGAKILKMLPDFLFDRFAAKQRKIKGN